MKLLNALEQREEELFATYKRNISYFESYISMEPVFTETDEEILRSEILSSEKENQRVAK